MKDGGPFHPVNLGAHAACIKEEGCRVSEGISMRDYFAAQVFSGLLAGLTTRDDFEMKWSDLADVAYGAADAMIKARG